MAEIRLSNGLVTLVDDEDYDLLVTLGSWNQHTRGYPMCYVRGSGRIARNRVYMHRFLMGLAVGDRRQVDHINVNPLDNRRANLRLCSWSENQHNKKLQRNNKSGVKGVYWYKAYSKWHCSITIDGKPVFLGYFSELDEASRAVSEARKRLHGSFANDG